jgi:uncharacterized membrane protein
MEMNRDRIAKLGPLVRLDLFTDAVFAIVITLLVIEIDVPPDTKNVTLSSTLLHMYPIFLAHIISFTVLGIEWIDHHSIFESARKCTRALMGSNLLFCLTLTSIPFLTKLIGYFPDSKVAVSLYSLGILAMTIGKEILWQVISRQNPPLAPQRRIMNALAICVGIVTSASALFSPRMAVVIWSCFGIYAVFIRIKPSHEPESTEEGVEGT